MTLTIYHDDPNYPQPIAIIDVLHASCHTNDNGTVTITAERPNRKETHWQRTLDQKLFHDVIIA